MPNRNSTLKRQENIIPTLRKSPRLLLKNQPSPLYPKTPEHRSRARRFIPDPSSLSSSDKGFVKKVSKNFEESKCGNNNLGKLNNGFVRSGVEISGFCVRRSPRLSCKGNVVDELLEREASNRKKERDLSNLGKKEVGFGLGRHGKSGTEKRVTRSLIRKNVEEVMRKKNRCKKGLQASERPMVVFDSGRKAEGKSIMEKRVTRGSVGGKADEITKKRNECKKGLSNAERGNQVFDLGKQAVCEVKIEKRVTRGSIRVDADEITNMKNKVKEGFLDIERHLLGAKSSSHISGKLKNHTGDKANSCAHFRHNLGKDLTCRCEAPSVFADTEDAMDRGFDIGTKTIGVKRKRNQDVENHGWTHDQELALQRAYFAAKPTPNFWKRVAKLVPGKSAQDCFNRIHADNLTPPQPRPRSRAANRNMSSSAQSASKLLKPEDPKIRKITRRKQKGHLAQKAVRQLLQKHYIVDQGYEADLFSVLESTSKPSTSVSYPTPQHDKCSNGLLKACYDKSSSALKKRFSRLSSSNGAGLVSPPVLKPVKNKALHEKYIDQLHCREAKRTVACAKGNPKKDSNHKMKAIEVLKGALVLDAKDFIHKFQHGNDSATREYSDYDENEGLDEDEEGCDF